MSDLLVRRDIQRAIDDAINPKGMSVHSGRAVVGADKLAYMLKAYDALAAERDRLLSDLKATEHELDAVTVERDRLAAELALIEGNRHPGYIIGQHWLSVAYSRICAGEDEAEVMRDYGWVRNG